jgi:hypothetical protein
MMGLIVSGMHRYAILDICEQQDIAYEQLHPDVRSGVRNADPVVWPVLEAVGRLYRAHRERLESDANHVGMIHYGSAYPKTTSRRVMTDVSRTGRVSPVAFINANAGAALSICCTRFGFRGPTMNLTMSAMRARTLADVLAVRWLAQGDARHLILVAADFDEAANIRVTAALVARLAPD